MGLKTIRVLVANNREGREIFTEISLPSPRYGGQSSDLRYEGKVRLINNNNNFPLA